MRVTEVEGRWNQVHVWTEQLETELGEYSQADSRGQNMRVLMLVGNEESAIWGPQNLSSDYFHFLSDSGTRMSVENKDRRDSYRGGEQKGKGMRQTSRKDKTERASL